MASSWFQSARMVWNHVACNSGSVHRRSDPGEPNDRTSQKSWASSLPAAFRGSLQIWPVKTSPVLRPFWSHFRAVRSDAKARPSACTLRTLMPLARTARTRQPIHRIWYIKASSLTVLRGDLPPANSKMASLYREVTLSVNHAL
jgi:hypothetical protein